MNKIYRFLDLAKVNEPYLDKLVEAVGRVVRSGRYIGGYEVDNFEHSLSQMLGVPYVIGVSNGLDALRLTLRAWIELGRLSKGDEVVVPGNTYIASILAISDAGLKPVLVDPDPVTMNLSAAGLETALSPQVRAVMPVHLYGRVAWSEELKEIIVRHSLLVIEDSAQAIGAKALCDGLYSSRMAGGLGDAGCLSFYPTKNIGALGDAGAVATHDKKLAETVRALANYGADYRYHNIYKGFNCRMDPMQAALLRVKLPHTLEENADRFARAVTYNRNIHNPGVITPQQSAGIVDHVWHQYVIRVTGGKRDMFREQLLERGVETDIHYATPPHLQPCYQEELFADSNNSQYGPLPVTERLASEIVSLPIATGTTVADAAEISEIINLIKL